MRLRNRILTAFLIILLFPACMIGTIGSMIITHQVRSIEMTFQVDTNTWEVMTEPVQVLNRMTRGTFNELCTMAEKYPDRFLDAARVETINTQLKQKYSYLIVEKDGKEVFVGDRNHYTMIRELLPETDSSDYVPYDGGIYVGSTEPFLVKTNSIRFSDGEIGNFYIVTDVKSLVVSLRSATTGVIFWALVVMAVTACVLVLWLYQGILKPLNALRRATRQIQDGNLEYSLQENIGDDEIGQLCQDFEEMRVHLKEEIEVRIQYEQDLRELISNISHDIKTPLTAIKGYAEGLLDGVADTPERQEKYLRTIYTKANDMTALIDELSFYTKIDANNIPYHFEHVKVNDYFMDCAEENTEELELINIHLEYFSNVKDDTRMLADREQIHRVMNNLIGNAVKYRGEKEKGNISISLFEEEKVVRVEVKDNGQGIEEKDLPNIFERFYRADASRNSKGGTGLGLAIVKKIIEEHGGTIYAQSKEGEETCIIFTLKKVTATNS